MALELINVSGFQIEGGKKPRDLFLLPAKSMRPLLHLIAVGEIQS